MPRTTSRPLTALTLGSGPFGGRRSSETPARLRRHVTNAAVFCALLRRKMLRFRKLGETPGNVCLRSPRGWPCARQSWAVRGCKLRRKPHAETVVPARMAVVRFCLLLPLDVVSFFSRWSKIIYPPIFLSTYLIYHLTIYLLSIFYLSTYT